MNRRHILPKADDRNWQLHTDFMSRGYMQNPVMVTAPFHSSFGFPPSQVYPYWGHPTGPQVWGPTGSPTWHPPHGNWLWKTHPGVMSQQLTTILLSLL